MIPSLENLKELEILIRFDCSCPNMSEITLNIIIDEHKNSREFGDLTRKFHSKIRTELDQLGPVRKIRTKLLDHGPDQLVSYRLSSNQNFEPIKFGPDQNFGPINSEPPTGPSKIRTKI